MVFAEWVYGINIKLYSRRTGRWIRYEDAAGKEVINLFYTGKTTKAITSASSEVDSRELYCDDDCHRDENLRTKK